jgi:hypothetical protein
MNADLYAESLSLIIYWIPSNLSSVFYYYHYSYIVRYDEYIHLYCPKLVHDLLVIRLLHHIS